jgi:hypothetical protein
MEKTITLDVKPTTEVGYEAIVDQCFLEMKHMQLKMDEDQQEIETLRAEMDMILADIKQTLKAA